MRFGFAWSACALAFVAATSSCFTFVSFDLDDGAGGGTVTSVGPGGGGGGGGGAGGGGGGAGPCADIESDPNNCGQCGWSCGPGSQCAQGVCTAVGVEEPGVFALALVGATRDRSVVAAVKPDMGLAFVELHVWPSALPSSAQQVIGNVPDGKSGALTTSDDFIYYRPRDLAACEAGACIEAVSVEPAGSVAQIRVSVDGSSIDAVEGLAVVSGTAYFTTSGANLVRAVSEACLRSVNGTDCSADASAQIVVSQMNDVGGMPITAKAAHLEATGGELWWTTYLGCVHHVPLGERSVQAACAFGLSDLEDTLPTVLTASEAGVFVATNATRVFQLTTLRSDAPKPIEDLDAPLDSDDRYLYAWAPATQEVVVVDPTTQTAIARQSVDAAVVAIEASDPNWVYFATSSTLYRWRKPAGL
ncbi:MAG TPA: hypothetical protein VL400_09915 [Polyangiaceae bacterium]|nr:hypothetical protein [Polyangiaceae bacterium]